MLTKTLTVVPRQMSSTRKNTQPLEIHIEHGGLKNRKLYSASVNKKYNNGKKEQKPGYIQIMPGV